MRRKDFIQAAILAGGTTLLSGCALTPGKSRRRKMVVVQCWDDGVTTDIRLVEILRRNGAKATFNLNAGLHSKGRVETRHKHKGQTVSRLGWDEVLDVYSGFTIANHSLTHPNLASSSIADARRNVKEGRDRLQQHFSQPVLGFAYPSGSYNDNVKTVVREAGHIYARTVVQAARCFPPADPMAFHPNCHHEVTDFWDRYEKARESGVFYFWGHSYELINDQMGALFEDKIKRISNDPGAEWGIVADLFASNAPHSKTANILSK
jgi:peptidoglycan/xylan/chitin deacetylase (PgdA/CDA1 family)